MKHQTHILAFGAHPDDVELSCSGTLLAHRAMGYSIGLIDLTRGELGTRGTADIRDTEAAESANKMGAICRENLDLGDGFFEVTKENLYRIIEVLRKYRPHIVFANALNDRHPDHARGAELVKRACFLSGLPKIKTKEQGEYQEPWRPQSVMHYIQDRYMKPDLVFDVSAFVEEKFKLIYTFKSQFYDPNSEEPETPISSKEFIDFLGARMRSFGREIGVAHAEGFCLNRAPGVQDLMQIQ
jgi:bacillithiol biosynthesis deacetylase BshB1